MQVASAMSLTCSKLATVRGHVLWTSCKLAAVCLNVTFSTAVSSPSSLSRSLSHMIFMDFLHLQKCQDASKCCLWSPTSPTAATSRPAQNILNSPAFPLVAGSTKPPAGSQWLWRAVLSSRPKVKLFYLLEPPRTLGELKKTSWDWAFEPSRASFLGIAAVYFTVFFFSCLEGCQGFEP